MTVGALRGNVSFYVIRQYGRAANTEPYITEGCTLYGFSLPASVMLKDDCM